MKFGRYGLSLVLGGIFLLAAWGKLGSFQGRSVWSGTLEALVFWPFARVLLWYLPWLEGVAGVTLCLGFGTWRRVGWILAGGLGLFFALGGLWAGLGKLSVSCGCLGAIDPDEPLLGSWHWWGRWGVLALLWVFCGAAQGWFSPPAGGKAL